jgi:hypothetical protein
MIERVFAVAGSVLLADVLSGLAHWLEDSYFTPATPLLGPTIGRNVLHHHEPDDFTRNPWHVTIRSSLVCSVVVAVLLFPFGLLGPVWCGALALAAFANQVHKWSHIRRDSVPGFIRWLHATRVLQSPAHHARHHGGDKNSRYCVITNIVNPVVDAMGMWRGLEAVVAATTGARPRTELSPRVV